MKNKIKNVAIITMGFVPSYELYQIGKEHRSNEKRKLLVMEWYHKSNVRKIVEGKNIWFEYEN